MGFQSALYYVKWLVIIQLSCGVFYTFFNRMDVFTDTHTLNEEKTITGHRSNHGGMRDSESLKRSLEQFPIKEGSGKHKEHSEEEDQDKVKEREY